MLIIIFVLIGLVLPAFSTSEYKVVSEHKGSTVITLNLEYTGKD
jgi:hypothetical protein